MKVKVPIYGTAPAKATYVEQGATVGAQIGVNLLLPDGKVGTLAQLQELFGSGTTGDTNTSGSINTTDDLDEGQWHLWFTDRRAQDAVGGILADTATIDLAYTGGASITATLKDLADSGTGTALVKITRDSKGRISGTSAATTTDLTEGSNLYFTDERAQDAAGAALDGTGDVPLTYDDAGKKISAALSAGVLASLALADSATQPGDLATVATTGAYADLSGLPTLGTAAATDATDYATAAQGALADSAVQPGDLGTAAALNVPASGDAGPTEVVLGNDSRLGGGGGSGDVVGPASAANDALALFDGATGKLLKDGGALNKAAVGLGNVDNTSDVNKPVSTAQAAAIALKQDISGLGTAAFANTGNNAGGFVPLLSTNAGQTILSLVGSTGRAAISGTTAELDGAGKPVLNITATGGPSTSGSSELRVGVLAFNTDGATANNRGGLFAIALKQDNSNSLVSRLNIGYLGHTTPGVDNAQTMGSSALRWSVVYAGTGTINTSDAREKTAVAPLTTAELSAAADLARAIGTYQWLAMVAEKSADGARHHAGLTVQRAIEIMQSHGLDPMRYGFICYDQWDETPEVVSTWPAQDAVLDESGNVITPAIEAGSEITQAYRPAGDRYSFRTDELLLFIARGFAARLDALEAKA